MTKIQYTVIAVVIIALSAAIGRYTAPVKVTHEVKTVEVIKEVTKVDTDTKVQTHKKTTVTEITAKDGTKTKTTVITDETEKGTQTSSTDIKRGSTTEVDKTVTERAPGVTLAALAGFKLNDLTSGPVYGGMVSKPILGPITAGAWVLSNTTGGLSIGLTF